MPDTGWVTAHIDHDRIPAMQANAVPAPESAPWAAPGPVAGPAAGSRASIWPGLLFAAAGVAVAYAVSAPFDMVGPMVAAIVLGVVVGNVARVPSVLEPGLAVASKRVLRIGIVVLGLRLSLHDVAGLGAGMILTVIAVVAGGIMAGVAIGRALGIGRRQRLLIACGIAICGAAAVAAVAGVLGGRADGGKVSDGEDDGDRGRDGGKAGANAEGAGEPGLRESVAAAIALVVVFGTLMIALVPMLGHALGLTDMEVGMWGGASVHEVAQVVAIGGSVGGAALGAAVVIKLGRVLMLVPVMAVLGVVERRRIRAAGGGGDVDLPPIMPLFVAGFLAMVAVRSTGVVPQGVLDAAGVAEQLLLGAAMFALGVGVRFSLIRKVGGAPVVMAAAATVVVAVIGLAGVLLAG